MKKKIIPAEDATTDQLASINLQMTPGEAYSVMELLRKGEADSKRQTKKKLVQGRKPSPEARAYEGIRAQRFARLSKTLGRTYAEHMKTRLGLPVEETDTD